MSLEELLTEFRDREKAPDLTKANWYNVAACALAASSAGYEVVKLYRFATRDVDLQTQKLVQRRIKEAIVKTMWLYGGPKALQALFPLFKDLRDEEIDHYGPRWEALHNNINDNTHTTSDSNASRGKRFFEGLWTPQAAKENLDFNFKHAPDLYLLVKTNLDDWASDETVLDFVETEMCYASALTCGNCPVQAAWHTRGIVRQGATMEQARFVQGMAVRVAEMFAARTGIIVGVDEIRWEDEGSHA